MVITPGGTGADVAVAAGAFVASGTLVVGTEVMVGRIVVGDGATGVSLARVDCGIWLERMTNVPVGVTVSVRGVVTVIFSEAVADGLELGEGNTNVPGWPSTLGVAVRVLVAVATSDVGVDDGSVVDVAVAVSVGVTGGRSAVVVALGAAIGAGAIGAINRPGWVARKLNALTLATMARAIAV